MNDFAANTVALRFPWRRASRAAATNMARLDYAGWSALTGAFLFSMLWGFRSFGIQDNNEGIYAEVAREMNARGDWIVPHLNGAPYLEKPPLLYWLEALLLRTFGDHDWVVRVGPVLCFAGTIAAVIWIGRQIRSLTVGRNAALLLCSAAGVVGMSRSLLFDVPLACALAWVLALFLQWRRAGSPWALRGCYALLAIGVLTKGLIAVVLGGGTMFFSTWLIDRSGRAVFRLLDLVGITVFLGLVVPWHLLASVREPGFAEFYFINEHVRRFLGSREPHDFYTGPFYYYLVRLPLYLGVWVFALPVLWRSSDRPAAKTSRTEAESRVVLAIAFGLALAFFSLSEGKANYYLLSAMPALVLLLTLQWPADGSRQRRLRIVGGGVTALGLAIAVAPRVLAHKPEVLALLASDDIPLIVAAVSLVTLGGVIILLVERGWNSAVFWCTALAGLLVLLPAPALLRQADPTLSERAVAQYLISHHDKPVVLFRDYERLSSMVFYLRHPVPVLESESNELYYAQRRYAGLASFLDLEHFRALVRRQGVWVVTTPDHEHEALHQFGPDVARVVRRFPRATVLSVGPAFALRADPEGGIAESDSHPGASRSLPVARETRQFIR